MTTEARTVCVVVYTGYLNEGDLPEVHGAFATRETAADWIAEQSRGYVHPESYAQQHYEIVETELRG